MRQPLGYVVPGQEEKVCRLRRSIYGLQQSAKCWNQKLFGVLESMGFVASSADPCWLALVQNGIKIYLIVYVDDLLMACLSEGELKRIYEALRIHFEICWLGDAKNFLGLELQRDSDGVYSLGVKCYLRNLLLKLDWRMQK